MLCAATPSCSGHQIIASLRSNEDGAEVPSAIGDLHVSTNIRDSFDLWRMVNLCPDSTNTSQSIQFVGAWRCPNVPKYTMSSCISAKVRSKRSWLGSHGFAVNSGSVQCSNPLCVIRECVFIATVVNPCACNETKPPRRRFVGTVHHSGRSPRGHALATLFTRQCRCCLCKGKGDTLSVILADACG